MTRSLPWIDGQNKIMLLRMTRNITYFWYLLHGTILVDLRGYEFIYFYLCTKPMCQCFGNIMSKIKFMFYLISRHGSVFCFRFIVQCDRRDRMKVWLTNNFLNQAWIHCCEKKMNIHMFTNYIKDYIHTTSLLFNAINTFLVVNN